MCIKVVDLFLTAEARNVNGVHNYNYDNTDVLVHIEEEDNYGIKRTVKYVATFFTYSNIFELQAEHHRSGEYLNGKYFFFKNMVIIDNCSKESITNVVNNLIEEGDFKDIFKRIWIV